MEDKKQSYLQKRIEAERKHDGNYSIIFQKARLKLQDPKEIAMLLEEEKELEKAIDANEDEVIITITPPSAFQPFYFLRNKKEMSRWIFANQLLKKVRSHQQSRIYLVVCPENILFDRGFTPYFLHFGVHESLPPYEKDEQILFEEVKATAAAAVDSKYSFEEYLQFHDTLKLSPAAADLLAAENYRELEKVIEGYIEKLEEQQKMFISIPVKKWNVHKYLLYGAAALLIPAIIFSLYTFFFMQPKQEAYVESGEHFLNKKYSRVIETLAIYEPEEMPYVVQYELASSYIVNENLGDEQKKAVQKMITLQTDPQYFLYWIYTGRGKNEQALEIARSLEYRDFIMFSLIKYREEIKADESLASEEKQEKIKAVDQELKDLESEKKEEEKLLQEQEEERSKLLPEAGADVQKSLPPVTADPESKDPTAEKQPASSGEKAL
ncbi:type VII secretion protein EssB [Bacillus aerolatus]|uniref:Type VII secretion protein EssB n=1 Tax=Bacillus aerolatus TaxID=2653354 RepID=A0A6I1FP86_9BACI|nr:type VII secretion protein EssB [Bacillus aerolatus]KAB7708254.1 type VII secretion protein EssB [Bacillus aerolatus]